MTLDAGTVDRLRAAVERASVTVVSDDHLVSVTVGAGGALTELDLPERALRLDRSALAEAIVRTLARATAQLHQTLVADLGELDDLGDRPADPAGLLAGSLPDALPAAPVQPPAPDDTDDPTRPTNPSGPGGSRPQTGADPAELVDRLRTESARTMDGYAALRAELAEATATARSPDGAVTATVRSGGAVADLRLDESAVRRGPKNLSRQVLAAIGRARADAAMNTAERVRELMGPRIDVTDLVASAIPPELRADDGTDRESGGAR